MNLHNKKSITVVGSGYVGMSLAVLLAQDNNVTVLDIDSERVNKINNRQSTIKDRDIDYYLKNKKLSIEATTNKKHAYKPNCEFIVIATPTNYDEETNSFDTSAVDSVVKDITDQKHDATIVIKSTVPVGYTKCLQAKYKNQKIIFSPEFLREGSALKDNLYPSRIILGSTSLEAEIFGNILKQSALDKNIKILYMNSAEAEAVKLFANTYLAMRVAFFNELDTYAYVNNLKAEEIINGISLDSRIGLSYNNPSFGYGGYCLPKDTKQLLANYKNTPQELIKAIVSSNSTRKQFIADVILQKKPKVVGIYKLAMKEGSDNYRDSAIFGVIDIIQKKGIEVLIHDPILNVKNFDGIMVEQSIDIFKEKSDLIITNRNHADLSDVNEKVFTRDVFNTN